MRVLVPEPSWIPPEDETTHPQRPLWRVYAGLPDAGPGDFVCLPHPLTDDLATGLHQLHGIEGIQVLTSGVDHLRGKVPRGIPVYRAPELRTDATAELAVLLTLSSLMGMKEWVLNGENQQWVWTPPAPRLAGLDVAVLGAGPLGRRIAELMVSFKARPRIFGRRAPSEPISCLPRYLPTAHVVVLALPLTHQTQHIVNEGFLAGMRTGAVLVNVARGRLIDTDALVDALSDGALWAALDVTDPEPLPPDHPLWTQPNVTISPHVGGNIRLDSVAVQTLLAGQVRRLAEGGSARFLVPNDHYEW